jgi:hypothetical protein
METYLEAIDVNVLRAASQGLPLPKDPKKSYYQVSKNTRSGMQRPKTPSLEAFARMFLTMCETTRTPMHYGWTFVCSMRELRVSVRNAITL